MGLGMEQVDFYLLKAAEPPARLQFACRIAKMAYDQGMTVYLQTEGVVQSQDLDKLLWTFSQESFVPHALSAPNLNWNKYPVQIGDKDNETGELDLLISLQADVPSNAINYRRIADIVIDQPEQKQLGRSRFRHYRQNGIEPKTHQL